MTINKYRVDADGELSRLLISGLINDGPRIQDHQIGFHSGANESAVAEPEQRRRQSGHSMNGICKGDRVELASIPSQNSWKCAIDARMRFRPQQTIRADRCERHSQETLHNFFALAESYH